MLCYTIPEKISILIGITDQRTLTLMLVLNISVLLYITSFLVAAIKQNKTNQPNNNNNNK